MSDEINRGPVADPDLAEILGRDLRRRVPEALVSMLEPGERALVVVDGVPGAIVATDRRVLVERWLHPTVAFRYDELTGAIAHVGIFSKRYVALTGPGLQSSFGFGMQGRSNNATVVQIWRMGQAKSAATDITKIVNAINAGARGKIEQP